MGKGGHGHGSHFGGGNHSSNHHYGGGSNSSSHHYGGENHNSSYQYGGRSNAEGAAMAFEISKDLLHNSSIPPSLINGIYSFIGNEMNFRTQMDQTLEYLQQQGQLQLQMQQQLQQQQQMNMIMLANNTLHQLTPSMQPMNALMPQINTPLQPNNVPVQQININLIGNKSKPSNNCCILWTSCCGCLIFPLCFPCCMWWKKIVYPKYELSSQAYRDVALLIERNLTANNLNLTVTDNAFNAEKAKILFDVVSRGQITAFTFTNEALDCNGQYNQADDFINNMLPIKSLTNASSSITWGQMIV